MPHVLVFVDTGAMMSYTMLLFANSTGCIVCSDIMISSYMLRLRIPLTVKR